MVRNPVPAGSTVGRLLMLAPVDPRPSTLFDHVWSQVADAGPVDMPRMNDLAGLVLEQFGYPVNTVRACPDLQAAVAAATIPEPGGCRWCGADRIDHGVRRHIRAGVHGWVEPADAQRAARIRAHNHDLQVVFG